ncbi:MAG: Ig-like domain-containing protein [Gemmatimonadota bacterium]|nr:Ig-like domain-containing protein [Gemmatimonadota bacterium]
MFAIFRRAAALCAVLFGATLVLIQACTSESITGVTVTEVSVTPSSSTIMVGETAEFEASVVDETGAELENAAVSWSATSDDGDIVDIDDAGVATALAPGEAEITASFEGAEGTASLTVIPLPDIGADPSSVTMYGGVDGPAPAPETVAVTNLGGGSLTGLSAAVSVSEGSPDGWLDAELAGETPPTELTLTADSTGFPAGAYEATVTLSSPDAPDGSAEVPVTLSLTGFTLMAPEGGVRVAEAEGTESFDVVLDREPDSDVVLTTSSADEGEAVVSPERLTFTPENWDTAQPVTVTGVDDDEPAGDQETVVTVSVDPASSDVAYRPAVDRSLTVTTLDDDAPGFDVVETDGSTIVSESGTTDSLEVSLRARPTENVVLTVAASDPGEATASPTTLTFTPTSWHVAQIVTVTGEDDSVVDGSQASTMTLSVDENRSDGDYHDLDDETVPVTTTDDDGAGIVVTDDQGSAVVSEDGGTDAFTVRLASEPSADVVLEVTSGDTGEVTVNPSTLTFTPEDWDESQPVTLTGEDDDVIDGDVVTDVTVSVDVGASASEYESAADEAVAVTTTDDDVAGLDVVESSGGTAVSEAGTSDEFTVALTAEPATDVVVEVTSGDTGEATVDPATLTFAPADWDTPQTVTVTGVDDDEADGNQETEVTVAVDAAGSDPDFEDVEPSVVTVTTSDDDQSGFTVTSGGTASVSEAEGTTDVTVVLNTQPASDVVLTFAIDDASVATVSPAELTFTSDNWDTEQAVTLTGADDDVDDGDQTATLTVAVDPDASDDDYDGLEDQTVEVTAEDDDAAGFTLADTASLTVSEDGTTTTDAFTVVLDAEPVDSVVLNVTSGDVGEATVDPASLTFTSGDWDTPQTVDADGRGRRRCRWGSGRRRSRCRSADGSDGAFTGLADQTATVTTTDDDVAGFTLADTASLTVSEDGTTTDAFTVVLDAEPVDDVVLNVTSGDTGEATVDPATLTFTSGDWDTPQTVDLTGVDDGVVDGDQETTVTVSVDASSDDAFTGLADQTASVTTTDDDAAGFTLADTASLTVSEDGRRRRTRSRWCWMRSRSTAWC